MRVSVYKRFDIKRARGQCAHANVGSGVGSYAHTCKATVRVRVNYRQCTFAFIPA